MITALFPLFIETLANFFLYKKVRETKFPALSDSQKGQSDMGNIIGGRKVLKPNF